jgi:cyclophilin family peptidyl-prolyl cis-trans isomerase
VEFVVEFEHDNNSHGSFVVEMASLESMPHSVNHFLHMIDHKLWDDTIFMQHVSHVIQTSPKDYKTYESVEGRFYEAGLTHLSFQEYSREYPHDEYTLGFEGRPGGPQFYINMENNQRIHGPGGQMHHDLHEEGEPCFGKIVSGKRVVDRMAQKNNEADMAASAPRVVRIVSARLMHHLTPIFGPQ